jgi:hypothetical protein
VGMRAVDTGENKEAGDLFCEVTSDSPTALLGGRLLMPSGPEYHQTSGMSRGRTKLQGGGCIPSTS